MKLKRGDVKLVTHSLKYLYPLELSLTHKVKYSRGKNQEYKDPQENFQDQYFQGNESFQNEENFQDQEFQDNESDSSVVFEPEESFEVE